MEWSGISTNAWKMKIGEKISERPSARDPVKLGTPQAAQAWDAIYKTLYESLTCSFVK